MMMVGLTFDDIAARGRVEYRHGHRKMTFWDRGRHSPVPLRFGDGGSGGFGEIERRKALQPGVQVSVKNDGAFAVLASDERSGVNCFVELPLTGNTIRD